MSGCTLCSSCPDPSLTPVAAGMSCTAPYLLLNSQCLGNARCLDGYDLYSFSCINFDTGDVMTPGCPDGQVLTRPVGMLPQCAAPLSVLCAAGWVRTNATSCDIACPDGSTFTIQSGYCMQSISCPLRTFFNASNGPLTACQAVTPCNPTPCLHEGVCSLDQGNFSCSCVEPWVGDTCQLNNATCITGNDTCTNNSTCLPGANGTWSYACSCTPGYSGFSCEVKATSNSSTGLAVGLAVACIVIAIIAVLLVLVIRRRRQLAAKDKASRPSMAMSEFGFGIPQSLPVDHSEIDPARVHLGSMLRKGKFDSIYSATLSVCL